MLRKNLFCSMGRRYVGMRNLERVRGSARKLMHRQMEFSASITTEEGGVHTFGNVTDLFAIGTCDSYSLKLMKLRKLTQSEINLRDTQYDQPQFVIGDHYSVLEQPKYHRAMFKDLLFSPRDHQLFSCSDDSTLSCFDVVLQKNATGCFIHNQSPMKLKSHHNPSIGILCSTSSSILSWDTRKINSSETLLSLSLEKSRIFDFDFIPEQNLIFIGTNLALQLHDLRKPSAPLSVLHTESPISTLALNSRKSHICTQLQNGNIYLTPLLSLPPSDVASGSPKILLKKFAAMNYKVNQSCKYAKASIAFSPSDKILACSDDKNNIQIFHTKSATKIETISRKSSSSKWKNETLGSDILTLSFRRAGLGRRDDPGLSLILGIGSMSRVTIVRQLEKSKFHKNVSLEATKNISMGVFDHPEVLRADWQKEGEATHRAVRSEFSCTFSQGYVDQQVWICMICHHLLNRGRKKGQKRVMKGYCTNCIRHCHKHEELDSEGGGGAFSKQHQLGLRKKFRCDCCSNNHGSNHSGTGPGHPKLARCLLVPSRGPVNDNNRYGPNFCNVYCYCEKVLVKNDPEEIFWYRCGFCEEWFHEKCIFSGYSGGNNGFGRNEGVDVEEEEVVSLNNEGMPVGSGVGGDSVEDYLMYLEGVKRKIREAGEGGETGLNGNPLGYYRYYCERCAVNTILKQWDEFCKKIILKNNSNEIRNCLLRFGKLTWEKLKSMFENTLKIEYRGIRGVFMIQEWNEKEYFELILKKLFENEKITDYNFVEKEKMVIGDEDKEKESERSQSSVIVSPLVTPTTPNEEVFEEIGESDEDEDEEDEGENDDDDMNDFIVG